jgi:hypothetical protein
LVGAPWHLLLVDVLVLEVLVRRLALLVHASFGLVGQRLTEAAAGLGVSASEVARRGV